MAKEDIRILENAMYEALVPGAPQIKIAALIVRTFGTDELPHECSIDAALYRLIARGDITSFGVIRRWRHSEIMRL